MRIIIAALMLSAAQPLPPEVQEVLKECTPGKVETEGPYPIHCQCMVLCLAEIHDDEADWSPADCIGMCD